MFFYLGLKDLPFEPEARQIIYAEGKFDLGINWHIFENYNAIRNIFRRKGYDFIFLPCIVDEIMYASPDIIKYNAPYSRGMKFRFPAMTNDYILQFMAHPENRSKVPPSLLYRVDIPRRKSPGVDLYMRGLSLSEKNFDTTNLVRALLAVIQDIGEDEEYFCSKASEHLDLGIYSEMDDYDEETKQLMADIDDRVRRLKLKGVKSYVVEQMVERAYSDLKGLSRMQITDDFRIILSDYGNMEIKMEPLPKSLYILFLRHEEGIAFKTLPDYQDELLEILRKVSGGELSSSKKNSVSKLVDMFNYSKLVNTNCTKIKCAFTACFADHLAKYYYVVGERGEARTVSLPRNLIQMTDKL